MEPGNSGPEYALGKKTYHARSIDYVLCPKCSADLKHPSSPMCSICGRTLKSGVSDRRCGNCITDPPYYDSVRSAFFYEGAARRIVHSMKYRGITRLASFMGEATAIKFEANDSSCPSIILPVPLHDEKLRQRGYNQAALIAESICLASNGPAHGPLEFYLDILERTVNTRTQAGLHKKERIANVKNAFRVKVPEKIVGRHVILVDDVFTTGATVSACAKALKRAGASRVSVYTFARVKDS
ncbi:ComF family protein [Desulforegula conservatrix]|uniref:ComF family protein n=1 Tax=Desulforegula conservatrix TaxID=153026 RepID=UPI0018DE4BC6|nr:ComF family protein [Desulforegula conservatrix]